MTEERNLDPRLLEWWESLSGQQMRQAREVAQTTARLLDPDAVYSLLRSHQLLVATYWTSSEDGPSFRMPDAVADFINCQPDRSHWRGVGSTEAAAEQAARHLGHSNFHLAEHGGFSNGESTWTFVEGEARNSR
ncbi:MAG: hypothetical protein QM779_11490 [Propionicimonas sp.]|uniref:hypothetical protein n=1 Tax=Propionicimonas sp. TaxID=1955623 RepID=UPI003D130688